MVNVWWVLSGILLLGTSAATAQAPRGVTLAEALRLAATHDPNVIQAQGNLRSAGSGVRAAKSQYLPSLNVASNGGSSFSEGPDRFDPITNQLVSGNTKSQSLSMGISSDVDLFTGFRRGGDVKAANAREEGAGASVDESVARSALDRRESRGAHFREDYPEKDEAHGRHNTVVFRGEDGRMHLRREPIPPLRDDLKQIIDENR